MAPRARQRGAKASPFQQFYEALGGRQLFLPTLISLGFVLIAIVLLITSPEHRTMASLTLLFFGVCAGTPLLTGARKFDAAITPEGFVVIRQGMKRTLAMLLVGGGFALACGLIGWSPILPTDPIIRGVGMVGAVFFSFAPLMAIWSFVHDRRFFRADAHGVEVHHNRFHRRLIWDQIIGIEANKYQVPCGEFLIGWVTPGQADETRALFSVAADWGKKPSVALVVDALIALRAKYGSNLAPLVPLLVEGAFEDEDDFDNDDDSVVS